MQTDQYVSYRISISRHELVAVRKYSVRLIIFAKLMGLSFYKNPVGSFICKGGQLLGKLPQLIGSLRNRLFESALSIFLTVFRIHLVHFNVSAFGHLGLEPDLFLKEKKLNRLNRFWHLWIIEGATISNSALLEIWRKKIPNIYLKKLNPNGECFRRLRKNKKIFHDETPYITAINETATFGIILKEWGSRDPVIEIPSEWRKKGRELLSDFGMPSDAWFACVHSRAGGYHSHLPGHDFRNSDIQTFVKGIDYIIEQGGWVIRLGDPSMKPLISRSHVIDYPHTEIRSPWMDLFLLSECNYVLGSCSGPASIGAAFGKPMAMVNCLPTSATATYCHDGLGLGTPKLLYSSELGRQLTFAETMASAVGNYRWFELYMEDALIPIDNDAEDILSICMELHSMSIGQFSMSREDQELQNRVKQLFHEGHYGYQSDCLFSPSFLRKHQYLIG